MKYSMRGFKKFIFGKSSRIRNSCVVTFDHLNCLQHIFLSYLKKLVKIFLIFMKIIFSEEKFSMRLWITRFCIISNFFHMCATMPTHKGRENDHTKIDHMIIITAKIDYNEI